jgi:hypothetical protein
VFDVKSTSNFLKLAAKISIVDDVSLTMCKRGTQKILKLMKMEESDDY